MTPTKRDEERARELLDDYMRVYRPMSEKLDRIAQAMTAAREEGRVWGVEFAATVAERLKNSNGPVIASYLREMLDDQPQPEAEE